MPSSYRTPSSRLALLALVLAAAVAAAACTPAQQKPVLATALDGRDQRDTSFEATLRVLDEHPEYVDELFTHARQHPKTLTRLLHVTAQHLHEADLAQSTAAELVAAPEGLETTLVASLDAMQDAPDAMNHAAAAIEARPHETARMLVQREMAIKNTVRELVQVVLKNPKAAEAFREALSENSAPLATIITNDPELTGVLFKSIAKAGLKRGESEFQSFLRAYTD
jgi:hypothetical protein